MRSIDPHVRRVASCAQILAQEAKMESQPRSLWSCFGTLSKRLTGIVAFIAMAVMALSWFSPAALAQSGTVALPGHMPKQVEDGSATLVGHYNPDQMIRLTIGLQTPHPAEEDQFLKELQTKSSPQFHKYLTADQWNARFAPSAQDEQAVVDWAQSQGLTVTHRFPHRLLVDVEGTMATVEKALNVTMNSYQIGSTNHFSNDRNPQIPGNLNGIVHDIEGLNDIQVMHPSMPDATPLASPVYAPGAPQAPGTSGQAEGNHALLVKAMAAHQKNSHGANPNITNGLYDPTDIYNSNAYDYNALQALGHCCNPNSNPGSSPPEASIAIATFGDINGADIAGFHNQYPYLAYLYNSFYIDGTPACCNNESTFDTEWSTATANSFGSQADTAHVWVYIGANFNNSTFTDMYGFMLSDGHARVFTTSWSCTEIFSCSTSTMDSRHNIFNSMLGQGWTLFAASGDRGASDDCNFESPAHTSVAYPGSDPDVISAGGTTLSLFSNGTYNSEVAWQGGTFTGACKGNNGGSGGGCSAYYAAPGYQSNQPCGSGSRAVPDISLNANAGQNYYYNGALSGFGGTSMVAPELAGFAAQENAYLLSLGNICGVNVGTNPCAPMGDIHGFLYFEGINPSYAPHYPFYDITSGCNSNDITTLDSLTFYCSGTGWDAVTGWGTANMLHLAWMINWSTAADTGRPTVSFGGPATGKWYNTDQFIDWSVSDSGGSFAPTGVAGFSQAWDFDPADVFSEPTPGQGNFYYSGPQFSNKTFGCTDITGALCTGASVGQGCHTVFVEAWDNMGFPSGTNTYGPICYDTVPPHTTDSLSGTLSGGTYVSGVTVTLNASDPAPGSGIASTTYQVNGGSINGYSGPFLVISAGLNKFTFFSTDVAGNVEGTESASFSITSPTVTTLSSSVNPAPSGKSVVFTAVVSPKLSGSPTGTVTFKDGATVLATHSLNSGKATFATTTLGVGSHSITATYNGATYFKTSTASLTEVVENSSTTTLTSSLNPSAFGQSVTFTATITHSGTGTPTGTVTFKNGSVTLGTGTVSGSKATLASSALTVAASHSITAVYSGDSHFTGSTSAPLIQKVNKANTSTTLKSSLNPSTLGTSITFTATVKSSTTGTPTGTVNFMDGATKIGSHALSAGVATFATTKLATGAHSITAVYLTTADYNASTSPVLSQKVNP